MTPPGEDDAADGASDDAVRAVVQAHLEAFNARDVEAVLDTFAEDAIFTAGEQFVVGHRALRIMFGDAFGAPVRAHLALNQAVVDGETAACELTETLTIAEGRHALDVAAFYTVRRGRLVRVKVYRDLMEPQDAAPPGR